jgi:hypothetical protein
LLLSERSTQLGRQPGYFLRSSGGNRAQLLGSETWTEVHELSQPGHTQASAGRNSGHNFFRGRRFNVKTHPHARIDPTIDKYDVVEQRVQSPERVAKRDPMPVDCRGML